LRQCFDAGAEGGGELLAPRGAERGQHLLFDGVDGLVAGAEGRVAFMGEVCLQDAAVDRMRPTGYPLLVLEFAQELVHGLRGDECPARQVGVGQPWLFIQCGEQCVLTDGGVVLMQCRGHRGVKCGLGTLEQVSGSAGTASPR
jgi:hypothetical protein